MSQSNVDSQNRSDSRITNSAITSNNLGVSETAGTTNVSFGAQNVVTADPEVLKKAWDIFNELAKGNSEISGDTIKAALDNSKNAVAAVQNTSQGVIDSLSKQLTAERSSSSEELIKSIAGYGALGVTAVVVILYFFVKRK